MRIAITHALCWPEVRRGGERYTQSLGAALVGRGHEVTILSSGWAGLTDELDGVRTVRLRRRHEDLGRHERDFGHRVLPYLVRGRYDAVHSLGRHDAVASIRAAAVHRDRRTVFTDLGNPDRTWWRTEGRRDHAAVHRVVRSVDVYGCMSRWSLAFLARDWGRTDGVVTPGGVGLDEFRPAPARASAPTLLFSGALAEARKGVADLLAALPLVVEREPDVRLQLSGPGDVSVLLAGLPPAVAERVEVLGQGAPEEQRDRYGAAWLTVLPSTHDSFGMALVESLACGTPLVVTTHGAPQELVDDGVTGELCRPHDPIDLADAVVRGLALTRRSTTVAACRQSAERFDWATSLAPACEALYHSPPGEDRRRARVRAG